MDFDQKAPSEKSKPLTAANLKAASAAASSKGGKKAKKGVPAWAQTQK